MDSRTPLSLLEAALGDPHEGLGSELFLFVSRITPLINVDLLIHDDCGRTLLTWRDDEPFGTGWHVPGGVIRYKELVDDRVRACAREELAADVTFDPTPLLVSETILDQRDRGHFISLLFRCQLLSQPDEGRRIGTGRPSQGDWKWHGGAPPDLLEVQRHYVRFF